MVQDFYDTAKSWGKEVVAKANPGNSISQAPGMSRLSSIARQLPSNIILRLSGFTLYPLPFKLFKAAVSLLLTAYCFLPTVLSAQGCAMCYTSAAASRAGAKEALANGVLILLVPPMVFFVLIAVVVYRYRNKFRETSDGRLKQESSWGIEEIADFRLPIVDFPESQSSIGNRKSTMGKHSPWVR